MSNGYALLNLKKCYNHALGVTPARNDGFFNDSAKGGHIRASGAGVPGWQRHTPRLSRFSLDSSVGNPPVKHHAIQENTHYVSNQKAHLKLTQLKTTGVRTMCPVKCLFWLLKYSYMYVSHTNTLSLLGEYATRC